MLAPDFMHEFELGDWKAVLMHLIRILIANKENSAQAMNRRYRQVPTFGRSTIRRFSDNVAGLKKLAARNYEDLLQCVILVFDGLLDGDDNKAVVSLLFTLAEWHALGKLCLHTETTLQWLEQCTTSLGSQLRKFQSETCQHFDTRELPKEAQARVRLEGRKSALQDAPPATSSRGRGRGRGRGSRARGRGSVTSTPAATATTQTSSTSTITPSLTLPNLEHPEIQQPQPQPQPKLRATAKKKEFNLHLIKLHALGDYVSFIRRFGTTDSYSTQP
ncbi:hypothetical protein H0H81_005104, partial [Sphagnurus paluster]